MTSDDELTAGIKSASGEAHRRRIAYHEAGHALVGVLLGQALLLVALDGHTHFEGERSEALLNSTGDLAPDDREHLLAHAKIAFAGTAAETIGLVGPHPCGPASDHEKAWKILQRLGPDRPKAQELNQEVQTMVLNYEPALHRIARTLLAEGTLGPERVNVLMASG